MTTVPADMPEPLAADEITPGVHLIQGADDVMRVEHVLPYTDTDHQPMIALTLRPLTGPREPFVAPYWPHELLRIAAPSEIEAVAEQERRIELVGALRDLAEQILTRRLPVSTYQSFTVVVDDLARLRQWAEAYGVEVDDVAPGKIPSIDVRRAGLIIHAQSPKQPSASLPADDPEGYGYSRPAEDDVEPVAPPAEGEGRALTGRTGNTGEQPIITPAGHYIAATSDGGPGACSAVCACGAVVAGHDSIAGAGRVLLADHIANIETAAEGGRDTSPSADATATDPGDRVDGLPSGPVRADAVPAAPPGGGAAGITPRRPTYDPHPTILTQPGEGFAPAYARYAASLDETNPGWHWDDTDRMAPGLATEARARRRADTTERPYECQGCGKTSRIAAHRPGCSVAAAFDARQNGSGQ